jgi:hypothetical protein
MRIIRDRASVGAPERFRSFFCFLTPLPGLDLFYTHTPGSAALHPGLITVPPTGEGLVMPQPEVAALPVLFPLMHQTSLLCVPLCLLWLDFRLLGNSLLALSPAGKRADSELHKNSKFEPVPSMYLIFKELSITLRVLNFKILFALVP